MKWIFRSSIAKGIIGGFLIFMVPVFVFSVIMNSRSINTARTEITNSYQTSIALLEKQMEDRVNVMSKTVDYLFTDTNILFLNYKEKVDAEQLFAYASLLENLKFYANASLLNGDIKIFLKNKGKSFSSVTGYANISSQDKKNILNQGSRETGRWKLDKGNLIFIRNPVYSRDSKGIVVMASIEKAEILKFLNNLNVSDPGGSLFIEDFDGNYLFSDKSVEVVKDKFFQKLNGMKTDANQFVFTNGKKDYRAIYKRSQTTGLTIGIYFSEDYAMRKISGTSSLMIIFSITSVLLALFFTWILYTKWLKPFHVLVEGMDKVGRGEFSTRITVIPKRDFGFVFAQFNKMVSDTEKLINDVYIAQLNTQSTQLKLLQSRINPHFLYNCLNSIYQMSMAEDNVGAGKMASYLGKYFRFIAKCSSETITMQEECDNVVTLLEIQNIRFNGRINYHIELDEAVKKIMVPSLIIQPIVENAIIHGMTQAQGKIFIQIIAKLNNENLMIMIEDDGESIAEQTLSEIRHNFNVFDASGVGMGLNNTHWRLKLKYGDKSGVQIDNLPGGGVRVILNMERIKGDISGV